MTANRFALVKNIPQYRIWLGMEWLILFFGVPLAISQGWIPLSGALSKLALLIAAALACALYLLRDKTFSNRRLGGLGKIKLIWRELLLRVFLCALLLLAGCYLLIPEMLFAFVKNNPRFWLAVFILYPCLSAWPQELIYRAFMFQRYAKLFGGNLGMVAASTIAFAFLHIIYLSWVSMTLTLIAGYVFSINYKKTGHLATAALEHAIYGNLVFTIGMGIFFYRSF